LTPYHHALSSANKWGGKAADYLHIHNWFDQSKESHGDFRHRAVRHHTEGIFECEAEFGITTLTSCGKSIPTRQIGEQHVMEDLGRIPTRSDWLRCIKPEAWMSPPRAVLAAREKKHGDLVD
jgi:hypothetical protein